MAQFIPRIYNNFYYKILGYFWGVTIILPGDTQFQIIDALYSDASNINLLSFKDICRNGYHVEIMNHDGLEYLLITNIIPGKNKSWNN